MILTQHEYEKVKEVFRLFFQNMKMKDEKSKSQIVRYAFLNEEITIEQIEKGINETLSNIQIQPNNTDMISKAEVIQMLREMQIESAKCCGFFVGHVTQIWVIEDLLGDKIHELGGKAYTVDKEGNVVDEEKESEE